jgi:hypothetical protein
VFSIKGKFLGALRAKPLEISGKTADNSDDLKGRLLSHGFHIGVNSKNVLLASHNGVTKVVV